MTLQEHGIALCQRLTEDVGKMCPPGIGSPERAWDITASADTDFNLALVTWQTEPTARNRDRVAAAYDRVLAAWKCAIAEYLASPERTR